MADIVNAALPESAPGSEGVEDQKTTQDAPAVSSPAPGAQADQSPPATADDELAEFKQTVKEAVAGEPAVSTEAKKPEDQTAKTDEPAEKTDEQKASDALSQESEAEKKWTDRPAWKQLTEIADKASPEAGKQVRATLRTLFKSQDDLTGALARAKPAQDVVREMFQSVGGSEQGFNNMRHLIRSFNDDPAGAVPMLEKLLTDAKGRAGMVLQSPEFLTEIKSLEDQVRDGQLTQEAFDRRKKEMLEVEQSRATQKRQTERSTATARTQAQTKAQQETQAAVEAVNAAETQWTADKLKNDPDFAAVQTLHAAFAQKNSLEFFSEKKRLPNVVEAKEILEKSFKQAKDEAGKFRPKARARTVVTDNGSGSSRDTRQQPQTELDEFRAEVEKAHKIRFG